ncbi:MAG: hypothetical protein U0264_05340 [Candidatus Kapaibacterium sp.]
MTTHLIEMSEDFIDFLNSHITRIEYAPGQGFHFCSISDRPPCAPTWMVVGFLINDHLDIFSSVVNDGNEVSINNEVRLLTHQEMRERLKQYLDKVEAEHKYKAGIVSITGDTSIVRKRIMSIRHLLPEKNVDGAIVRH